MSSLYINQPPDIPMYLYKRNGTALINLIKWAVQEHRSRLRYCAENGRFKELKRLNEDYSPIRVLAELEGLRKICATITQESWDKLSGRERVFIRRAYEMKELLRQV